MADVFIAIKPKYPTRKAVDKVLFNDGNFLTIINEKSTTQLSALLNTSYVSLIKNNKYYPVDTENFEAQYALVEAGQTPTVAEDANFGVKTLDYFASATATEGLTNIQDCVEVYNGIINAKLFKVIDHSKIAKTEVNKNGFWFVFKYDLTAATAEGYSNVKLFNGTAIVNGDNYVYLGSSEDEVNKYVFTIKATLTVNNESGDAIVSFIHRFTTSVMIEADAVPAIEVNGREVASISAAFAALAGKGGTIVVNKSTADTSTTPIIIEDGKEYNLVLANNAVVTLSNYFHLKYGTFNFKGNGTVKEATPTYCIITLNNTDLEKFAVVNVDKGITLKGWFGTIIKKNVVNTVFNCAGTINSQNNGTDNGAAITVNGEATAATVHFTGSTEGSVGFGMYIAGNTDVTIENAVVTGTDGGIEQRAGMLVINNSRITTTSTAEPTMISSPSGTTSTGCAVAIAQHTTQKEINVLINNSTLIGPAAFMEGNPEGNPSATEDTHVAINSGSFVGSIKTLTPASDCTKFLYGGIYNAKPDDAYVAAGYIAKLTSNGRYEIVKQ